MISISNRWLLTNVTDAGIRLLLTHTNRQLSEKPIGILINYYINILFYLFQLII